MTLVYVFVGLSVWAIVSTFTAQLLKSKLRHLEAMLIQAESDRDMLAKLSHWKDEQNDALCREIDREREANCELQDRVAELSFEDDPADWWKGD